MPDEPTKGTVLIVDDDDTIISFIEMVLTFEGFRCLGAMNGEDAVRIVEQEKPSLVLLDLSMPKMDGREFCHWLHSEGHSDVPVIIMTAGHNAAKTCEEIGAQACLAKPFDVSELQSTIKQWAPQKA